MTAAHDSRAEAMKEAAVLRSLADQVASPVVAGRKSRKAMTVKQRWQWKGITDIIVSEPTLGDVNSESVADQWKQRCRTFGIGTGLFGWLVWNWAFPLLIELAKLWIESRKKQQD